MFLFICITPKLKSVGFSDTPVLASETPESDIIPRAGVGQYS